MVTEKRLKGICGKLASVLGLFVLSLMLTGCYAQKKHRSYKQYDRKQTQFDQKKYKFTKKYPPSQTYYSKNPLFRPKK